MSTKHIEMDLPNKVDTVFIPLGAEDHESVTSSESSQSQVAEGNEEFYEFHEEVDAEWARFINSVYFEAPLPQISGESDLQSETDPSESFECEICLGIAHVRRSCCKLYFCDDCMTTYINTKVSEGQFQIQCPGSNCRTLLHHDRIQESLSPEMQRKFIKFFTDANADPTSKTCPCCGTIYSIDPKELKKSKRKLRHGLQICCPQCKFVWCFLCQAPYHTGLTCKEYRKGDGMVRKWAKEWSYGQFNAQKCPKCKIYIQKAHGCDHMRCSHCKTDFCYRCGGRYIRTKYFGNHLSDFSIFGCKYRFMPNRPVLRRLIRGASFAACLGGGIILAALGLALGAGLVGASVVIVPGYGIFRLRKRIKRKRQRKMYEARKAALVEMLNCDNYLFTNMVAREAALRPLWRSESEEMQASSAVGAEAGTVEGVDTQQVHVIVHRSMSKNQDDMATKFSSRGASLQEEREERGFFVNKYTAEGSEMVVVTSSGEGASQGSNPDSVITMTDFKEIPGTGGYTTLVANIVSRPAVGKGTQAMSGSTGTDITGDGCDGGGDTVDFPLESQSDDVQIERDLRKFQGAFKKESDDGKGKEKSKDDNWKVEMFEGRQRRRSASFPRNARELVQACARTDCLGYRRKVTSHQTTQPQQEDSKSCVEDEEAGLPASCVSDDETIENGHGYNGCFGNILSKLGQGQQSSGLQGGNNSGAISKHQNVTAASSQKNFGFGSKSSTWEKTRRDCCVQALLLKRALSNAGAGDVETSCVGVLGNETMRMSNILQHIDSEKASLSKILAGISQLDRSEDVEESVLLRMSKLDPSQVQRSLLEDFIGGGSKQLSKKLQQHGGDGPEGKKESLLQASYQVCKKSVGLNATKNLCGSRNAQQDQCGAQDMTAVDLAAINGNPSKRRRSMEETGTDSFYEDDTLVDGSAGGCSNTSSKNDLPQILSSPHVGLDRKISPSIVITRL